MSEQSKSPPSLKNGHKTQKEVQNKQGKRLNDNSNNNQVNEKGRTIQEPKIYDQSDLFLSSLARKCQNFFNWASNTRSDSYPELLWKNQMTIRASQLYPELSNTEIARLIDRDWKYMPQEQRNKICQNYSKTPTLDQLQKLIQNVNLELLY